MKDQVLACPECGHAFTFTVGEQDFFAVCAQCRRNTHVPFEPRGDRPVYCSDCFESRRSGSYGASRGRRW